MITPICKQVLSSLPSAMSGICPPLTTCTATMLARTCCAIAVTSKLVPASALSPPLLPHHPQRGLNMAANMSLLQCKSDYIPVLLRTFQLLLVSLAGSQTPHSGLQGFHAVFPLPLWPPVLLLRLCCSAPAVSGPWAQWALTQSTYSFLGLQYFPQICPKFPLLMSFRSLLRCHIFTVAFLKV